jgi:hypothetical protein
VGSGLQKHHLIELRFAPRLGVAPGDIPAIALIPGEHQPFTNAWREAIGYIGDHNPINTASATLNDIWRAAQDVYQDYPELLGFIREFLNK